MIVLLLKVLLVDQDLLYSFSLNVQNTGRKKVGQDRVTSQIVTFFSFVFHLHN